MSPLVSRSISASKDKSAGPSASSTAKYPQVWHTTCVSCAHAGPYRPRGVKGQFETQCVDAERVQSLL